MISVVGGVWRRDTIRWGVPPSIHGSWSQEQQAAANDNAGVDSDGLLSPN